MAATEASQNTFPTRTHEIDCVEYDPERGTCAPAELPPAKRAQYGCLQCDALWPGNVGPTECPRCGCRYLVWLNR